MPKTCREINENFRRQQGAGRRGLCNAPNMEFARPITVEEVIPGSVVRAMPQGVVRTVTKIVSTVVCGRHEGHDDGVCRGWGFSIIKPLEWPTPPSRKAWALPDKAGHQVIS